MNKLISLTFLVFLIGSAPAHAEPIYNIEILPAKPDAKPYHFSCSVRLSPCSIAINVGSLLEPKVIEIETYVSNLSIQFGFFYKRDALLTEPRGKASFNFKQDNQEPVIVDLYKPAVQDSPINAVVRPPPKFITSLHISWFPQEQKKGDQLKN